MRNVRHLGIAVCAIFSRAMVRDLPVEVADRDRSQMSVSFVDAICSAPGVKVTTCSSDLNDAEQAVRSGKAIAAVNIPENLERDVVRGRRPQITIFFNKQFFAARNITSNSIRAAVSAAVAGLEAGPHCRAFTLGPVVVEQHVAPHLMATTYPM